jgi:hypothetical protein
METEKCVNADVDNICTLCNDPCNDKETCPDYELYTGDTQ